MAQVFSRRAQLGVKLSFLSLAGILLALLAWWAGAHRADERIGEPIGQPIPFSHKHHVGDDGIDCRYCHTTVETSAFAGLPSTAICLGCHAQLYADAAVLEPLRRSAASGQPIEWQRDHSLPDFVFFNHSVHVAKGVACLECHGHVDQMPITWRVQRLDMQWCLGCHRDPAPHLRPQSEVFSMDRSAAGTADATALARSVPLESERRRLDCSTCHR
ncbi:MAG: cytochrome c family protein [Pseudomonadota bacterium]|nr:cytochrome c family protein [Pseudomonadota bacterium]